MNTYTIHFSLKGIYKTTKQENEPIQEVAKTYVAEKLELLQIALSAQVESPYVIEKARLLDSIEKEQNAYELHFDFKGHRSLPASNEQEAEEKFNKSLQQEMMFIEEKLLQTEIGDTEGYITKIELV